MLKVRKQEIFPCTIASRLVGLRERMANAAVKAGRDPAEVDLVAVSKTHSAEAVGEAMEAGQRVFGENRVQEFLAKIPLVPASAEWHFIGHLQKNKIRKVLPLAALIHGVDSLELAQAIDRVAGELGVRPRILLEVNVAGEDSKFGFAPDAVTSQIALILALPHLQVEGLMTVPPPTADPESVRPYFVRLRELRDALAAKSATPLPVLSMGMSGDFEVAIEEGATLVRVGTALFGGRE